MQNLENAIERAKQRSEETGLRFWVVKEKGEPSETGPYFITRNMMAAFPKPVEVVYSTDTGRVV